MSAAPFLLDAVLFDLDGTLIATDRFWIQAARTGARRAFEELGIERALPTRDEWMGVVGHPLEEGFGALFRDLSSRERKVVLEACVAEEERLLAGGGAALMPGTVELLEDLEAAGIRIGVASNCAQGYLDHMLEQLGLGRWVGEARCLDSPGIRSKTDMLTDLLTLWETRRAVMVGDRAGDARAAHDNGLPHVHCAFGFAQEEVQAEATIEDLGALVGVLSQRRARLDRLLDRLGRSRRRGTRVVGVAGPPAAGKSILARDLQEILEQRGASVWVASTDAWELGGGEPFPWQDLERELLDPLVEGQPVHVERKWLDRQRVPRVQELSGRGPEWLLLEGSRVLEARLQSRLETTVVLEVSDACVLSRVAAREGRLLGPEPLSQVRSRELPAYRALVEGLGRAGDRVTLHGENPLRLV